jgi:hypothetical protein
MALRYSLQTENIKFPGGEIDVRGLSFPDLAKLVEVHREQLVPLFDKYSGRNPEKMVIEDSGAVLLDILTAAPTAMGHIIAVAADEEDQLPLIWQMPIGVQGEILVKIAELTFKTAGGAGNLTSIVAKLVRTAVEESRNLRA